MLHVPCCPRQTLDEDSTGFLSVEELRANLMKFGEPLSEAECDALFRGMPTDDHGRVNCQAFMDSLLPGSA